MTISDADFFVEMVSAAFQGKPPLARHRAVNSLLAPEFDRGLHALSLRLKTPEEIARERSAVAELVINHVMKTMHV